MQVIKPPTDLWELHDNETLTIFAGGSIEQGAAAMWQDDLNRLLEPISGNIYNPRRDNWDASLEQRISNPQFLEQLEWEYLAMELASKLFFYFDPNTKSPTVDPDDMTVVCPDGFWRKGNVEFICNKFDITVFNDFNAGVANLCQGIGAEALPVLL